MAMWQPGKNYLKKIVIVFCVIVVAAKVNSQVNETANSSVYDYLYRMAQKGLIKWTDYQLPVDRKSISSAINELFAKQDKLTKVEYRELNFYRQEYLFDDSLNNEKIIFKKDAFNRFRAAKFEEGGAKIFVDPLIGLQFSKAGDKNIRHYFSGIRLAGYLEKDGVLILLSGITRKRVTACPTLVLFLLPKGLCLPSKDRNWLIIAVSITILATDGRTGRLLQDRKIFRGVMELVEISHYPDEHLRFLLSNLIFNPGTGCTLIIFTVGFNQISLTQHDHTTQEPVYPIVQEKFIIQNLSLTTR